MPKEMEVSSTKTAIEDLINMRQLKKTMPALTWAEFENRTGLNWTTALNQSERISVDFGKGQITYPSCTSLQVYYPIKADILYMPGGSDPADHHVREGFACAKWPRYGGTPKAAALRTRRAFALLTHGFIWHEDVFRIAAEVVGYLGMFNYTALHARYNDFAEKQTDPSDIFEETSPPFWLTAANNRTLYVSSDEPGRFKRFREAGEKYGVRMLVWPDFFTETTGFLLQPMKDQFTPERWYKLLGPVENLICTFARVFVGTHLSTFSGYIAALRLRADAPVARTILEVGVSDRGEAQAKAVEAEIEAWEAKGGAGAFKVLPRSSGVAL